MIYKPVSLTESQIGKYVDINGDGIPEGVIFADLAIGGDKLWNGTPNTHYRYEKSSKKLKEYVVVGTYSHALNGKREMLTPILDGEDRFYIMALNDVGKDEHCWYHKASFKGMIDYEETTLETFGSGKQNTLNMIEKWNKEDYGTQNSDDMWSLIQEQVDDGWFVPSIREWCAFAEELHINLGRETADSYWSSSQRDKITSFGIDFKVGDFFITTTDVPYSIRLAKTI
mgnify:FL=1